MTSGSPLGTHSHPGNMENPDNNQPSVSRRTFISTSAAATAFLVHPQPLPGAHHDSPKTSPKSTLANCVKENREWQYKRFLKDLMARLHDGHIDEALACLEAFSEEYPTDPEFLYGLCIAHCLKGSLDKATVFAQRAVDYGLPFTRFQAGPRSMLAPLYAHPPFRQLINKYGSLLLHGPLLGCVTDREARFWVRTAQSANIHVTVIEANTNQTSFSSETVTTGPQSDYTAIARVSGLKPNTRYTYQVYIDRVAVDEMYSFSTFPPQGEPATFEIGFGGCSGYTPWHEHIWRTIAQYEFPLFLQTGDNVYIDDPERHTINEFCYYRRQSRPEYKALTAATSIAAIWDDHDFGDNDSWGGPEINTPSWKMPVWQIFKNNWNNPAYGGGEDQPGCWFAFSIADVELFMLDDRYYRDNHNSPPTDRPPTMLGEAQKKWLLDRIKASDATFKVIVTSVPWAYGVKPGSNDPWQGFMDEREEIFSFFEKEKVDGIFLLSGDRHRADIWRIERENGYDLYDFENARLTNLHTHDVLPGAIYGYNEKCHFGRLRFDTTLEDPEVIYDIITIDDELVHSFPLKLSSIRHP